MHWQSYLTDQCADRYYTNGSACGAQALTRGQCAALAAFDSERALQNPANFAYLIVALSDSSYAEKQRCKSLSRAMKPYGDSDGDCRCAEGSVCYTGSSRTCQNSRGGWDSHFFLPSCPNCKCTVSPKSRCHASAVDPRPDSDGDCRCPDDTACYTYDSRGCRSSLSEHSTEYFLATCATCQCRYIPMESPVPLADYGQHGRASGIGVRVSPSVIPPPASHEPAHNLLSSFDGVLLVTICGVIFAFFLVASGIAYGYHALCRKKTRRVASDMEFQEAFQTQQAQPVHV